MFPRQLKAALAACLIGVGSTATAASDITLFRFFGSCNDQYSGVTELDKAVGECGIIQVLTNRFNATNDLGARVDTQAVDWGSYYNRLNASMVNRNPPAVAVMHRSYIGDYAARRLLTPLDDKLAAAGIDKGDLAPAALEGVTYEGTVYALPFDLHAILWHMNTGLLDEGGLVDSGAPVIPGSVDELMAQAEQFKQATGKPYLLLAGSVDPMVTRLFETLVWQQGGHVVSDDLSTAGVDSDAGREALGLINTLIDKGYMAAQYNYTDAQQAFLNGEGAVLINGTWVIDEYSEQAESGSGALAAYAVDAFPTLYGEPAVWADSHTWVLPRGGATGEAQDAAVAFLGHLYANNLVWARTGHLPVRTSVLEGEALAELPHRSDILRTADDARSVPLATRRQSAIQDALNEQLQATYLTGKDQGEALAEAQRRINDILAAGR